MSEMKFNLTDDLENLKMLEAKLKEKAENLCNKCHSAYIQLKFKLIELAEDITTENKLKFLMFLDSTGLTLEDIIQLLPNLFTHCITHLFIKKLVFELIEVKREIKNNYDIARIYEKLSSIGCPMPTDKTNDTKQQEPIFKPKRKPRTKKPINFRNIAGQTPTPQPTPQPEQTKEQPRKIELKFN